MENNEDIIKSVPRTQEELDEIRSQIAGDDTQKVLDKTYDRNEKIKLCRKIVKMFESDEFQSFWKTIHTEMKKMIDTSPAHIKGNPFEKLEQLGIIQGGLEILESQDVQMEIIRKTAQGEIVDTSPLEEKLKVINK